MRSRGVSRSKLDANGARAARGLLVWVAVTAACVHEDARLVADDCPTGQSSCAGSCVRTDIDPQHCGACDRACSTDELCQQGACGFECVGGTSPCGQSCVDLTSDRDHCGTCEQACGANELCSSSSCAQFCMAPTVQCGNQCVDTSTSPAHCGACDDPCPAGSACETAICVAPRSCRALLVANPASASGPYSIDADGVGPSQPFVAYCDMSGGGWTLVLKLAAGDFCYGSLRWDEQAPLNESASLDPMPQGAGTYDAKSQAFYLVSDVTELRFDTLTGTVTTSFAFAASAQTLMTTNMVPFQQYPDRAAWVQAFGHDRHEAPIFMRAGQPVTAGNACRNNPAATPNGCGQPCVFCYQAADGNCCPCNVTGNDVNSGIGNHPAYCGGGQASCSTASVWSNPSNVTLVWAR